MDFCLSVLHKGIYYALCFAACFFSLLKIVWQVLHRGLPHSFLYMPSIP